MFKSQSILKLYYLVRSIEEELVTGIDRVANMKLKKGWLFCFAIIMIMARKSR